MVWALQYRPNPDSYPGSEVVEGNSGELELEDPTPDGGTALVVSRGFSGRRVKPESVPKVIRFKSKRPLLDYEGTWNIYSVSDRFRALIETIEPGVHQFEPVRFIGKDGSDLGTRWFWQICNRIDSVHREKTDWVLEGGVIWGPSASFDSRNPTFPVHDLHKIGHAKFWHDKHISNAAYVSDDAKSLIEAAAITGVHFTHREQA